MLNHLIPVVDMGATVCIGSDRYPAEIVRVSESGKTFWIRYVNYIAVSGCSNCGSATYEFSREHGAVYEIPIRKTNGGWMMKGGNRVWIGTQERYHDPHF